MQPYISVPLMGGGKKWPCLCFVLLSCRTKSGRCATDPRAAPQQDTRELASLAFNTLVFEKAAHFGLWTVHSGGAQSCTGTIAGLRRIPSSTRFCASVPIWSLQSFCQPSNGSWQLTGKQMHTLSLVFPPWHTGAGAFRLLSGHCRSSPLAFLRSLGTNCLAVVKRCSQRQMGGRCNITPSRKPQQEIIRASACRTRSSFWAIQAVKFDLAVHLSDS